MPVLNFPLDAPLDFSEAVILVPVQPGDPTYVDHAQEAVDRLCWQFRSASRREEP